MRVIKTKIKDLGLGIGDIKKLKNRENCVLNGKAIKYKDVTVPGNKARSYAYCADTKYDKKIIPFIKDVDVIYHESTFLEKHIKLSKTTKHSTAKQAAKIAKLSNVKLLILGHYSSRYDNIDVFKIEAKTEFENIVLAEDNKIIEI